MKKKIIIILCILFIICLCVTSYYNLIHPIKLVSVNVECINWDATYVELEAFENNYNNGENMVRGIELKFVANGDYFGKQELEIDLLNVDDITVER